MGKDLFKKTVSYGLGRVVINERADGNFALRWREGEGAAWRRTTVSAGKGESGAVIKAREVAKRVDAVLSGSGKVSAMEAELLQRLKDVLSGDVGRLAVVMEGVTRVMEVMPGGVSFEGVCDGLVERWALQKMTVEELLAKVGELYGAGTGKRMRSFKALGDELRAFVKVWPEVQVAVVNEGDFLLEWVGRKKLDGGEVSAQYFNNRLAVWKNVLNRAREWRVLPDGASTAAEGIEKRKLPQRMPEVFSVREAGGCLAVLVREGDLAALSGFVIALFTGMRPSEVCRLTWGHVELEHGVINADERVCLKLAIARFVPLSEVLCEVLGRLRGMMSQEDDELICGAEKWRAISRVVRGAGVVKRWPEDVTRHSYVSYRLAVCKNANLVADECGNSAAIIKKKYRRPIRTQEGEKFFGLLREWRVLLGD